MENRYRERNDREEKGTMGTGEGQFYVLYLKGNGQELKAYIYIRPKYLKVVVDVICEYCPLEGRLRKKIGFL